MAKPRILFLDIETSPDLAYVWRLYDASAIAVKEHWKILSFSAEWLQGGIITKGLCDYKDNSEELLLDDLWDLLDQADIVVAHNGASFDMKKINARFIFYGFDPPAPYKVVDTLREIRKVAKFSSNKLDWLSQQLDLGKKTPHEGFSLWLGCMENNPKSWKKMLKYNRHDVVLLKKLYKLLAPWISQPNAGTWVFDACCPNPACGSKDLQRRGLARNRTRVYQRFQCKQCGTWGRSTSVNPEKATVVKV
jgi:hypothetical protein